MINRLKIINKFNLKELIPAGLVTVSVGISPALSTKANAYQLGTVSQVDWYNKSKAFYPEYLDIVLQIYEKEYENDRTNTGTALSGGIAGERKFYLIWYQMLSPVHEHPVHLNVVYKTGTRGVKSSPLR